MHNKRKLLKRILSLLLLIAVVFPQGIYAYTADNYKSADSALYSYMLTISTGNGACDYVDKITLKYVSTDGLLCTQTLDPTANLTSFRSAVSGGFSSTTAMNGFTYAQYMDASGPSYLGNINLFYRAVVSNNTAASYINYDKMFTNIFSYKLDKSNTVEYKNTKSNMSEFFRANTTEYISFRTENSVDRFISVEFILRDETKEHVCDWSLNGWKIFKVINWSDKNQSSYTGPEFYSYGYFSDRMGVSFEGQLCAQSLKMVDGEYPGFDKKDGISRIIFTDKDQKISIKTSQTVNGKQVLTPSYYYNFNGTYDYLAYDMTSVTGDNYNGYTIGQIYQSTDKRYVFKVDISQENGAGVESFLSVDGQKSIVLRDVLTAKIRYTNDYGYTELVNVPIISNSVMEYAKLSNNGTTLYDAVLSKKAVYAYAQEGTSLLFCVDFPNIVSLDTVEIKLNNPDDPEDEVIIDDIEVYELAEGVDTSQLFENKTDLGIIDMCFKGGSGDSSKCTLKYVSDPDMSDVSIKKSGESATFEMTTSTGDDSQYSDNIEDTYVITINTSDVPDAGTTENVYFRYSYMDTSGQIHQSEECVMTDLCSDFYGYNKGLVTEEGKTVNADFLKEIQDALPWANAKLCNNIYYSGSKVTSSAGIAVDVNYISHMSKGSSIKLLVTIRDFKKFTDFSFRMESGTDLWQIDSISTEKLISFGDRILTKQSDTTKLYCVKNHPKAYISYGFVVDRKYEAEKGSYVLYDDVDLLLQKDDESTFEIENENVETEKKGRDYTGYYLSMDYSKAISGLQFDSVAMTYDVKVTVAGNESIVSDDDAGSGNLFYFQLVFENGMSGFVLANQQLQSDGFRAGQTESFTITTNENYGDITAIRIIPDEVSEDGDKLDKLKIDQIEVISSGAGEEKKCTVFYNIGWIGAEYFETAGTKGRSGKTLQEAATTSLPSSNANVTSLEFTILTGNYESSGDQFKGTLTADITYKNSNGELKTERSIDVVKKMYEYMDRNVSGNLTDTTKTSDTTWMFRDGHADRFIVDITDIKELVSIKLYAKAETDVDWPISAISVHMVDGEGQLFLNSSNDFQRKYSEDDYVSITDKVSNKTMPCKFKLVAGDVLTQTFAFANGTLPETEDSGSGFESLARVPESSDDTVNIFMYMTDDALLPEDGDYTLNMSLNYSSVSTGKNYKRTLTSLNPNCTYIIDEEEKVLCFMGVSASYLSQINSFSVTTDVDTDYAKFDSIIIQHVRNNVIIDAFDLSVIGGSAGSKYGLTAYAGVTASTEASQVLTLHLAAETEDYSIVAETRDIAASLMYTSSKEPSGTAKTVYSSKNVFASDGGTYAIDGGTMVSFSFNESYIDSIDGIKISTVNGASCVVDSAVLECYSIDANGVKTLTDYISFSPSEPVAVEGSSVIKPNDVYDPDKGDKQNTSNKLRRVDLSFTTINPNEYDSGSEISKIDSNGASPIKMVINYVADSGISKTKLEKFVCNDIRELAGYSGSFAQGGTATVSLFLPGIKRISSIELIPYSETEGETATWNLGSITYAISDSKYSSPRTLPVYCRITEKNNMGTFYLSDMTVNLTVSGDGIETQTFSDSTVTLAGNPGDVLTIAASVDGTFQSYGYGYKIEQIVDDAKVKVSEKSSVSNNTSFTYKLPDYDSDKGGNTYIITVYAEENPTLSSSLEITLIKPSEDK